MKNTNKKANETLETVLVATPTVLGMAAGFGFGFYEFSKDPEHTQVIDGALNAILAMQLGGAAGLAIGCSLWGAHYGISNLYAKIKGTHREYKKKYQK